MIEAIRSSQRHALPALLLLIATSGVAHGQTTAFTYQGQLSDAGALANGSYDLRFALFDSAAGGAQIGADQSVAAVPVSAGIFTVQLDFGVSAFPGANRFVEIGVRPAGGGSFTILAPRQQISSSPYAIQTLNAQQLGGVPASQYVKASGNGNVGIGTTNAQPVRLFVDGGPAWSANGWSGSLGFQNGSAIGWQPNNSGQQFGIGQSNGGLYFFRTNSAFGANTSEVDYDMVITDSGNVGLGTTTPQSKLTLRDSGYGFTQTDGTVTVGTYVGAGGGWYGTRSNHPLHFFTNNSSPLMTIDTSGNLSATGNATQARDKGGWVKAAASVNQAGVIKACYNSQTGAASGTCGFVVSHLSDGFYLIDFGFRVDDRFLSVTPFASLQVGGGFTGTNSAFAAFFGLASNDTSFMVIVY